MSKLVRVEKDDPSRCQATHAQFQCPFHAVGTRTNGVWEGPQYCARHGGTTQLDLAERQNQRMYTVAKWKSKIGEMVDNPGYKSLTEEIGVLRVLLSEKLDLCHDSNQLVLYSNSIASLIDKIRDTVRAVSKLDRESGNMLDKSQAQVFVNNLVSIITMYVEDPFILQAMSEDMLKEFDKLTQKRV